MEPLNLAKTAFEDTAYTPEFSEVLASLPRPPRWYSFQCGNQRQQEVKKSQLHYGLTRKNVFAPEIVYRRQFGIATLHFKLTTDINGALFFGMWIARRDVGRIKSGLREHLRR